MSPRDRSADRHSKTRQTDVSVRLNNPDLERLEATWRAVRMPSRRQAIIAAIREWLDRNESNEHEEQT